MASISNAVLQCTGSYLYTPDLLSNQEFLDQDTYHGNDLFRTHMKLARVIPALQPQH